MAIMGAHDAARVQSIVITDGALYKTDKNLNSFLRFLLQTPIVHKLGEIAGQSYFYKYPRIEKMLIGEYGQQPDEEAVNGYLDGLKMTVLLGVSWKWLGQKTSFLLICKR